MLCEFVYYEGDKGYMCSLDKKECPLVRPDSTNCLASLLGHLAEKRTAAEEAEAEK